MATSSRRKRPLAKRARKTERMELRHERTVLSGADRDVFLAAVLNPPEPTDRLVRALKRHRELFG